MITKNINVSKGAINGAIVIMTFLLLMIIK